MKLEKCEKKMCFCLKRCAQLMNHLVLFEGFNKAVLYFEQTIDFIVSENLQSKQKPRFIMTLLKASKTYPISNNCGSLTVSIF